jgi:hypothetical protein
VIVTVSLACWNDGSHDVGFGSFHLLPKVRVADLLHEHEPIRGSHPIQVAVDQLVGSPGEGPRRGRDH